MYFSSSSSCIFNACPGILRLCKAFLMSLACRHIYEADTQKRNMSGNESQSGGTTVTFNSSATTPCHILYLHYNLLTVARPSRKLSNCHMCPSQEIKGGRECLMKSLSYSLNVNRFHFPLFPRAFHRMQFSQSGSGERTSVAPRYRPLSFSKHFGNL